MSIILDGTNGIDTPAINAGNIVGEVAFFALNTPPTGWLKANGAAISRSTYSALFDAIGTTYGAGDGSTTFNLPDMRGEFPRGWDDGRGVDSGRSFGTAQLDQMQRITGSIGVIGVQASAGEDNIFKNPQTGLLSRGGGPSSEERLFPGASSGSGQSLQVNSANSPNARVSDTTDGETRSRNIALLACIKF